MPNNALRIVFYRGLEWTGKSWDKHNDRLAPNVERIWF